MMKLIRVILLGLLICFGLIACGRAMEISPTAEITLTYHYGDVQIDSALTDEEETTLRKILTGKRLHSDQPSCGFTDEIALLIDGVPYAFARDGCAVLRAGEDQQYISLTEEEHAKLRQIVERCGGTFPCL